MICFEKALARHDDTGREAEVFRPIIESFPSELTDSARQPYWLYQVVIEGKQRTFLGSVLRAMADFEINAARYRALKHDCGIFALAALDADLVDLENESNGTKFKANDDSLDIGPIFDPRVIALSPEPNITEVTTSAHVIKKVSLDETGSDWYASKLGANGGVVVSTLDAMQTFYDAPHVATGILRPRVFITVA